MLKNNKTFTKSIKTYALLPILMFSFSMCLLLAPGHVYATDFVTGSYSAGDYSDSSYNQGSEDTSNNIDSNSNNSSDNDNSNSSNSNSDESTTTVTNPDTDTTTTTNATEDQIEDQKLPIDKSSTTVGVIIAIGAVTLVLIATVLLWVKNTKQNKLKID